MNAPSSNLQDVVTPHDDDDIPTGDVVRQVNQMRVSVHSAKRLIDGSNKSKSRMGPSGTPAAQEL